MADASSVLMQLRPVTFSYRDEYVKGESLEEYGLIAEEVAEVAPRLVALDEEGKPFTVRYGHLAPMLLNELQKQHRMIEEQGAQIEALLARIQRLESLRASLLEATN